MHLPRLLLLSGLTIALTGCSTSGARVSASPEPGMTTIAYTVNIKAPIARTWTVLADFGHLGWTQSITNVRYLSEKRDGVGMARHCDLASGGYIEERITRWTPGREYTYAIDNASDPIDPRSYVTWRVIGDEHQSSVTFEVNYKLKYWVFGDIMNSLVATKKFSKQIVGFMEELKTHLEKQG